MREIKFRAWDKAMNIIRNVNALGWKTNTVMLETGIGTSAKCTFDNVVLMQYTGLLDKKGKEIYEGDIVETEQDIWGTKEKNKSKIVYKDGRFTPFWSEHSMDCVSPENCEIIGNIYENPELLK